MDFLEKLQKIQFEMKAPKNLYNSYGKYNYRNAEGILEAFKPYGEKYKVVLTVSDEIVERGDRVYVKADAMLTDCESGKFITNSAFAREAEEKKGMDESQITGTASSYARKYALNGLFLLDDTKDADTDEYKKQTEQQPEGITAEQLGLIKTELLRTAIKEETVCKRYKKTKLEELTKDQANNALASLRKSRNGDNSKS